MFKGCFAAEISFPEWIPRVSATALRCDMRKSRHDESSKNLTNVLQPLVCHNRVTCLRHRVYGERRWLDPCQSIVLRRCWYPDRSGSVK